MATRLQKKTTRKNARRGTGPSSAEGKARSSQNAITHGLFARDAVLPDEDLQEFLDSIAELEQELGAVGGFECRLVRQIACTEWRMRRLVRLETGALTHQLEKERQHGLRIQAEFGNLPPGPRPNPGGQVPPPKPGAENSSSPAGPDRPNTEPPGGYQQTTRDLGSSIVAYRDSPVLLSLSLYETRLSRKYLTLLKLLRQTQKLRLTEEAEQNKTSEPRHETAQPTKKTAKARRGTAEPRNETGGPRSETGEPDNETAEPKRETAKTGKRTKSPEMEREPEAPQPPPAEARHHATRLESETQQPRGKTPAPENGDRRQAPEMRQEKSASGTRVAPQDKMTSAA